MAGQEIASFYASIGADTKDFKKGLDETKTSMSGLEKNSAALGNAFKLAFGVGVAAVVGFGAVIGKSIGAAADMEQGVADIGAMMSLTSEDTAKLGQHILDLGLDPNLKVSATEASEAIMSLGTAGLSVEQIMGGASEATVLLANATGLSGGAGLANAASIATDVMAQFNIKAEDMGKAVSGIAGTTVASKFSIDDYRLAIAQAGGVASSVGVGFDDFNAVIAAISPSFASGSDAGTSLKTMLQRLVPSTDKAKIALKDLGLMADDGSAKFFDASGKMKSMEEIAGLLHTAFSGLSDAQKIESASTLFGTDSMRAALALAEGGAPIIAKMKSAIGDVSAEDLATKRMDTFKGAMEVAQGVIETLSISIGQAFLPVLRPLVEVFTQLAQKIGPVVIEFFKDVALRLTNWVKPITDALKGTDALSNNLQMMWEIGVKVVEAIQRFVKPLTDAITKFFSWKDILATVALLLAGPVLAAIGAVIGGLVSFLAPILAVVVAVAALRKAWENDFLGIRTIALDAFAKLAKWFEGTGIWKGSIQDTLYGSGGIQPTLITWSLFTQNKIAAWVQGAKDKFEGWKGDVVRIFTVWADTIVSKWHEWTDPTLRAVTIWATLTLQKFENWRDWIFRYIREIKEWIVDKWEAVLDWFSDHVQPMVNKGKAIIQGLWDGIKDKWYDLTDWFSGVWGDLTRRFKSFFGIHSPSKVFAGYGEDISLGLAKGIGSASGAVYDAMGSLTPALTSNVSVAGGSASTAAANPNSRVEELLAILIQELRSKNMTANVTVNGGGGSYGALVSGTAGLAR